MAMLAVIVDASVQWCVSNISVHTIVFVMLAREATPIRRVTCSIVGTRPTRGISTSQKGLEGCC